MAKDPVRDTYAMTVSDDPLDGDDVRGLRFGVALRGYAMDQVDAVLDRLAAELDARDARVAEVEAELAARRGSSSASAGVDA
jgi:DivIVA domain-containing protein